MTQHSPITKYDEYNARMAKSMLDKLFFVDKVDASLFVDFGCADGTLIRYMMDWMPTGTAFIGYDNDQEMCHRAAFVFTRPESVEKYGEGIRNVVFYHNWGTVAEFVAMRKAEGKKTAVILSSVLHEVYHYSDPREVDKFWTQILDAGFDYIIIRDMIPSESVDRQSDNSDVAKVLAKYRGSKELKDFERRWGSIQSNKNLVHFLLKYRYLTPNWEREVRENYFPMYREDLMAMIPREYDVLYHEHGVLPFVKRTVREDIGIELRDATHLKLILERR